MPVPFQQNPQGQRFTQVPQQAPKSIAPEVMQPQQRMPTRTQQMFAAPPPNYNPRSNVFRLAPRNQHQPHYNQHCQGPQPMSGVSHYVSRTLPPTGNNWRNSANPTAPNYYTTIYHTAIPFYMIVLSAIALIAVIKPQILLRRNCTRNSHGNNRKSKEPSSTATANTPTLPEENLTDDHPPATLSHKIIK